MLEIAREYLHVILPTAALIVGVVSGGHALLSKQEPRSQLGWLVVCLFVPVFGSVAYWSFGSNRIVTKARRWQRLGRFELGPHELTYERAGTRLAEQHPDQAATLTALLNISARVTRNPLMSGNRVTPLYNGEEAYPAMLEAIRGAERYVYLCSYIFGARGIGREFVDALVDAGERGVSVLVLIDAIGERYSRPRVSSVLRRRKNVEVARFLPFTLSLRGLHVNLRNHRKILIVDGETGFTGGMNIDGRHMVRDPKNRRPTQDIHFRVEGPAVYALEQVFLEDWWFTTDLYSEPPGRCGMIEGGHALCRGIKDGPNEDYEALQWILVGAISCAKRSVKIMTPYFIPSPELNAALTSAALRGVDVQIVLPEKSNLPFVDWATQGMLPRVIRHGVSVYYQPPPFAHSKLLVVDDFYVNIGSANLDPRSLQLNFEFNLEVYDPELGKKLSTHFDEVVVASKRLRLDELQARSLPVRLRNALFMLFAPYL